MEKSRSSTTKTSWTNSVVDLVRYPFTEPSNPVWRQVVDRAQHELQSLGCCVLPGFIRASAGDLLRRECATIAPQAYYEIETVNAYNTQVDPALPDDHPARFLMKRGNAFVARDRIPPDLVIHRLYTDPSFHHFIARCFGLAAVHELADPLAGLCLNVITPGLEHPWHFDTNEFAVSLLTQAPQAGGAFEFCPNIRSAQAENFTDVRAVLTGEDRHRVRRLTLRPGDLQLFLGRYSMHRVSLVRGELARHSAIFAYTERPDVVGSIARTRQLFGRVLPAHRAAEHNSVRVDHLLD